MIFFVPVVVLLFVFGCDSLQLPDNPITGPKASGGGSSFVGGSSSMLLDILQPPEKGKVSPITPLVVSVNVKNAGESFADGQVCVVGLAQDIFSDAGCKCEEFSLKGRARSKDEVVDGEEETFEFSQGLPSLDEFVMNDFSVTAIARYNYKTYASFEGCVRKDLKDSKDCKSRQDLKLLGVSSAPLQISSISQDILRVSDDEYTMTVYLNVVHASNGQFFSSSLNKDSCSDEENPSKSVDVRLYNAPGKSSCAPLTFKKSENKASSVCTITGVQVRDYDPLINAELSYAYEVRESNSFEVA